MHGGAPRVLHGGFCMRFCMVPLGGLLGRPRGGLPSLGRHCAGFCMVPRFRTRFCMVPRMVPRCVLQGGRAGPLSGLARARGRGRGGLGASPPFRFRLKGGNWLPQPPRPPRCRGLDLGGRLPTSLIPYNAGSPAGWVSPKPAFSLRGLLLNSLIPYYAGSPALPAIPRSLDSPIP